MIVKLVHFHILELSQAVNVPYTIAQVIFSQIILDEVHVHVLLGGLALWHNDDLAELADDVPVVWQTNGWIHLNLLL